MEKFETFVLLPLNVLFFVAFAKTWIEDKNFQVKYGHTGSYIEVNQQITCIQINFVHAQSWIFGYLQEHNGVIEQIEQKDSSAFDERIVY